MPEGYDDLLKQEAAKTNTVDDYKVEHNDRATQDIIKKVEAMKDKRGFHNVPFEKLPSKGKFYASNMTIAIRPMRIEEVNDVTSTDETNIVDVYNGLNTMLETCTRIKYGDTLGNYRDLLKCDEMYLLFLIRELTYPSATITLDIPAGSCDTAGCKAVPFMKVRISDLTINYQEDESIMKYYNEIDKTFRFRMKNGETIDMKPSTIGSHAKAFDYAVEKETHQEKYSKGVLQIVPLTIKWEDLTEKQILDFSSNILGWDIEKFNVIYRLAKKVDQYGQSLTTEIECPVCGGRLTVPVTFPGNFQDIFIPDVSDESDYGLV